MIWEWTVRTASRRKHTGEVEAPTLHGALQLIMLDLRHGDRKLTVRLARQPEVERRERVPIGVLGTY